MFDVVGVANVCTIVSVDHLSKQNLGHSELIEYVCIFFPKHAFQCGYKMYIHRVQFNHLWFTKWSLYMTFSHLYRWLMHVYAHMYEFMREYSNDYIWLISLNTRAISGWSDPIHMQVLFNVTIDNLQIIINPCKIWYYQICHIFRMFAHSIKRV